MVPLCRPEPSDMLQPRPDVSPYGERANKSALFLSQPLVCDALSIIRVLIPDLAYSVSGPQPAPGPAWPIVYASCAPRRVGTALYGKNHRAVR